MIDSMKSFIVTFSLAALFIAPLASLSIATPASAAPFTRGDGCTSTFLTFPAWYDGLERKDDTCNIAGPQAGQGGAGISKFVFRIVLNVIELALQLVGYAAVGFVIYGGFKYLTSAGSADRITSGRKIIMNAVIGLVISFFSVAIVNLIASGI